MARGVGDRGALFIAIYNDQRALSKVWNLFKRTYVGGSIGRAVSNSAGGL